MIRGIQESDLPRIREIHERFYKNEFDLPDFTKHFIHAFTITDSNNSIISVGGIRPILEIVALTDKDKGIREKIGALNDLLTISQFIANHDNFDELHVFIQDPDWMGQLIRKGFRETRGKSLVFSF